MSLINRGKVYIYAGRSTLGTIPQVTFVGDTLKTFLGWDVSCGDVNDDGKKDVTVLGQNQLMSQVEQHYFYLSVFLGTSDFQMTRNYYIDARHVPGGFQENVKCFDADSGGVGDILVNRIHIFSGGTTLDTLPSYTILPPNSDTLTYGRFPAVGGGGDFNRDGAKDIIMRGPFRVLIYLGGRGLRQGFVAFKQRDVFDAFGASFDNAGDVNGDGVDDIIIGGPGYFNGFGQGMFGIYSGDTTLVVSVKEEQTTPSRAFLNQNYPNPFNPQTTIKYSLETTEHVTLAIYNLQGQIVTELVNTVQHRGEYRVTWDGKDKNGEPVSRAS